MDLTRPLRISIAMLLTVLAMGTVGYMIIEGWNFMDAFYMTVITLTTVGYGEVHIQNTAGRLFTIALVFSGVILFLYVASALVQFLVEGQIRNLVGRRTLNKKIGKLEDHHIVCGYGRIGKVLCTHFKAHGIDPVVVEKDSGQIEQMEADGVLYIVGDATEEEVLIQAGIKKAKVIIAVLATDTDNVFLVLTAHQLNPDIFIMARASTNRAKTKLLAAGANRVESPYEVGAVSMAQRVLRPSVTNFLDLVFAYDRKDIKMDEIPVDPASKLVNVMLKDSGIRQKYNLILIAIKKPDGEMLFNPSFETVIRGGDTVIAMGKNDQVAELEKVLCPAKWKYA